jgi:aryl-alcohol dehydrogenase-like predicted oxidoreductase
MTHRQAVVPTGAGLPVGGRTAVTSRLAIGTSSLGEHKTAAPVYDAFFERGGNVFDTAWIYGERFSPGCCERALGTWIAERRCERDVVLLAKGGHPPRCRPELLVRDLEESLERLGVSSVAVYMPHRDDQSVPVGEFVDALAAITEAGLAEAYGLSNWSIERYAEATRYAARAGRPDLWGLSNHLSLTEMVNPIYPGVVGTGETARRWLAETGTRLSPWSAQARGLFARGRPADVWGPEFGPTWGSIANEARVRRTTELAAELGVRPVNVSLAWVLSQPFPTLPVVGPRTPEEVVDCLASVPLRLSPADVEWLWTGNRPEHAPPEGSS